MKSKKNFLVWLTTAQTCILSSLLLMRCILCSLAKREPHISNNNHSIMMPLPHNIEKKELLWYSIASFQNWCLCTNKCITILILLPLLEQWSWLASHALVVSRMRSNVPGKHFERGEVDFSTPEVEAIWWDCSIEFGQRLSKIIWI